MTSYRDKLAEGLIDVIMSAGLSEDGSTVHIFSAEIVDELVSCIAFVMHTSEVCASPSSTRKFCNDVARAIQKRIVAAKEQIPPGAISTVHIDGSEQ